MWGVDCQYIPIPKINGTVGIKFRPTVQEITQPRQNDPCFSSRKIFAGPKTQLLDLTWWSHGCLCDRETKCYGLELGTSGFVAYFGLQGPKHKKSTFWGNFLALKWLQRLQNGSKWPQKGLIRPVSVPLCKKKVRKQQKLATSEHCKHFSRLVVNLLKNLRKKWK